MGFGPNNNRLYSERHEQEIASLYVEDEYSLNEVERETGVNMETVRAILHRQGVRLRPPGCGRTQEPISTLDLTRTAWLHEQGLTYEQIASLIELKPGGVKHRIKVAKERLGYKTTNRGKNNRPKKSIPVVVKETVERWSEEAAAQGFEP